jgi:pyruvate dehydrogenase E2 component (dihydrolipoamide acetyltransferase)
MHTVVMPKLGDTMEEGKLLSWSKKVGDSVKKGESLGEIETEKTNIELESFFEGVLRKVLIEPGATVPVGTPIALVGAATEALPGEAGAEPATATTSAHSAGSAAPVRAQPAEAASAVTASNGANGHVAAAVAAPAVETGSRVFVSPIARRIAAEHGLDLSVIRGSGPGGRIIRDDVEAVLAAQIAQPAQVAGPAFVLPVEPAAPVAAEADVEVVPLSQMRKTIARRLQQSMQTVPHFYMTVSVDATALGELRTSINQYAEGLPQPIKVSLNDLLLRGVALTLARAPEVNVSFDGEHLLRKKHINLGVAVALDGGLIVPVIHDADKRSVLEIARESRRLIDAARTNKLKADDLQGGTFSVSNAGMYGVESFTAVINPPEAAILAVGAATPTPVVRDGQVVVREMMKLTLSSDHRVLDGAVSARFLQALKTLLEAPMGLVL